MSFYNAPSRQDSAGEPGYVGDSKKHGLDKYTGQDGTRPPPTHKEVPTLWGTYNKKGEEFDKDLVKDANNTVDTLLIFAGLFSAVISAFISQTYPMIKPDQNDVTVAIWQELRKQGSSTADGTDPLTIPAYAIRVNCFLFAGLFASMLVASLCILVKQWTRSYERELAGVSSHHLRARIRHFRYNGARRMQLVPIIGLLSIIMHLSLFISAVGIIDLLLQTAPEVGRTALSVFMLGALFFLVTTLLPLFISDAPFRSPLSKMLGTARLKMVRWWQRRRRTSSRETSRMEEGLENHFDLDEHQESEENSIVRSKVTLDLEIICHLLLDADKFTETYLLVDCLTKLPQLRLLTAKHVDAIRSREIIPTLFMHLVEGCMDPLTNGVNKPHWDRARRLCNFLPWYLHLIDDEKRRAKMLEQLKPKGRRHAMFPAMEKHYSYEYRLCGKAAEGAIEHLDSAVPPKDKLGDAVVQCVSCDDTRRALENLLDCPMPDRTKKTRKVQDMIGALIVKRTNCIVQQDRSRTMSAEKTKEACEPFIETLERALDNCTLGQDPEKVLSSILRRHSLDASASLREEWFDCVQQLLKDAKERSSRSAAATPIWGLSSGQSSATFPTQTPIGFDSPLLSPPLLDNSGPFPGPTRVVSFAATPQSQSP